MDSSQLNQAKAVINSGMSIRAAFLLASKHNLKTHMYTVSFTLISGHFLKGLCNRIQWPIYIIILVMISNYKALLGLMSIFFALNFSSLAANPVIYPVPQKSLSKVQLDRSPVPMSPKLLKSVQPFPRNLS